jgi:hypothetical protein
MALFASTSFSTLVCSKRTRYDLGVFVALPFTRQTCVSSAPITKRLDWSLLDLNTAVESKDVMLDGKGELNIRIMYPCTTME